MLTHKTRFLLALFAVVALVATFGFVSRYPDLGRKAAMAERHTVGDTISMWPLLEISASDPSWKWPDGRKQTIQGELAADALYRIAAPGPPQ